MRALRHIGLIVGSGLLLGGLWPGTLLAQGTAPDRTILLYQRMLQRNSRDARAYYRLGDAYIQKARESGDVTYFDLAEQALRKALEISPRYSDALRHLAFALYSRHDFAGAAREAGTAIDLNPGDSHAYGILGDAYLEVGKYAEAGQTYQKMLQLRGDLYSYSRRSGLRSLRGDAEGAIEDLKRAIEDGWASRQPRESVAWAQWQLGSDYFALGNLPGADAQYREALKTYPNYYRALAGLAQVRAAQEQYPEAIELYQKAIATIPLPDYAAAVGDVYKKLGRPEEAKRQYDLVEYIGYLNSLNEILYNRELAYFYADHDMKLKEALDLAKKELGVRQDIYAYDVLAWALYKNGKPQEARAPMQEALKLGTRDARLFFHAGMIAAALGEVEGAKAHLRRALETNPHFHLFHADLARKTLQDLDRDGSRAAGK
ncbi:MAG: tetratricopeptide repeat protein [Candidatus Methylomirabilales bacterium]